MCVWVLQTFGSDNTFLRTFYFRFNIENFHRLLGVCSFFLCVSVRFCVCFSLSISVCVCVFDISGVASRANKAAHDPFTICWSIMSSLLLRHITLNKKDYKTKRKWIMIFGSSVRLPLHMNTLPCWIFYPECYYCVWLCYVIYITK